MKGQAGPVKRKPGLRRLWAVSPPRGEVEAALVDRWQAAGLLPSLALLMRPGPGEWARHGLEFAPRLRGFWSRVRALPDANRLPIWLAVSASSLPTGAELRSSGFAGVHLKGDWTPERVALALAKFCPENPSDSIDLHAPTQAAPEAPRSLAVSLSLHVDDHRLPPELEARLSHATFAPVFTPRTDGEHKRPVGVRALEHACRCLPFPVIALGGVQPQHIGELFEAGAHGVATIRGLFGADAQLRHYGRALREALASRTAPQAASPCSDESATPT